MKIAIMCSSFAVGGAENMVAQLIAGLKAKGADLFVVTSNPKIDSHIQKKVDLTGAKVFYNDSSKKNLFARIKNFYRINSILRKEKPDVIHTNLSIVIYAIPYVFFHKVKLIHTVHNIPCKDVGGSTRFLLRLLVKMKKIRFSSISKQIQHEIVKEYGVNEENAPVIVNPVDCDLYDELVSTRKMARKIRYVSVGRLAPQKNHVLLLRAFKKVLDEGVDAQLTIAGDGVLKDELIDYACQHRIDNRVIFLGEVSNIPELLIESDVFVLSSDYEGLPLTLLEAMAAGLPIVSTDVGGVSDIVKDNFNGLLVPPQNVEMLAKSMLRLTQDEKLRKFFALNSLKMIRQYDVSHFVEKYNSFYME